VAVVFLKKLLHKGDYVIVLRKHSYNFCNFNYFFISPGISRRSRQSRTFFVLFLF